MRFDLHVHSTYSDGKLNLLELADLAQKQRIAGFALTDHDTLDGWKSAAEAEKKTGVYIFPAVEISTDVVENYVKRDVHILGYCVKDSEALNGYLKRQQERRIERAKSMVRKMNGLGLDISFDRVREIAGDGVIGRPHLADALVEKGYCADRAHAFAKYLKRGCSTYVQCSKPSPLEAVNIIHECGGYAVLAHPGLDNAKKQLEPLFREGHLDGVEVWHSSHNPHNSAEFECKAKELGICCTGGSDFHCFPKDDSDGGHGILGYVSLEEENLPFFIKEALKQKREGK